MTSSKKNKLKRQRQKIAHYIADNPDPRIVIRMIEKRASRSPDAVLDPVDKQSRTIFELLAENGHDTIIEQLLVDELTNCEVLRDVKRKLLVIAGARGYLQILLEHAPTQCALSRRALHRALVMFSHHVACVIQTLLTVFKAFDSRPYIQLVIDYLYLFPPAPPSPNVSSPPTERASYTLSCADVHLFCPLQLYSEICSNSRLALQLIRAAKMLPSEVLPASLREQVLLAVELMTDCSSSHIEAVSASFLPLRVFCRLVSRGFNTLIIYQILGCQTKLTHLEWMKLRKLKTVDGSTAWHFAAILGDSHTVERLLNTSASVMRGGIEPIEALIELCRPMVNDANRNADTPFLLACAYGRMAIIQLFLELNLADLYVTNVRQETALILACKQGHRQVVDVILHALVRGTDLSGVRTISPSHRDPNHWLAWTTGNGEYEIEACVLQYTKRCDVDGHAAVGYAAQGGHEAIVGSITKFSTRLQKIMLDARTSI